MRRGRRLGRAFFARDALTVAPDLLHKVLVHDDPAGPLAVRIVEVEAYGGADDPGSHGFRGPTPRTASMFGPPGHLYVYFTYGMHWCVNVVTGAPGAASAVLLRAGIPVDGIEVMRSRRVAARRDRDLTSGPAKLAQALGLSGVHDGIDLTRGPVRVVDDGMAPPDEVCWTPRIGLAPGKGDTQPWRCTVPGVPEPRRAARARTSRSAPERRR
ncbi:MAG: DNA-3-methyladenine glycosylase [Actinomycetota bacterium]